MSGPVPERSPAGAWEVPDDPRGAAEAAPGVWMSVPFETVAETGLGGGYMRFDADADLGAWRLTYDEVLHVSSGEMTIEPLDPAGTPLRIAAGSSALLARGATVRYAGVAGTQAVFVTSPRGARPVAADA